MTPADIAATLRSIHGDVVPLPNRPTVEEYAAIIAAWLPIATPGAERPTSAIREAWNQQEAEIARLQVIEHAAYVASECHHFQSCACGCHAALRVAIARTRKGVLA